MAHFRDVVGAKAVYCKNLSNKINPNILGNFMSQVGHVVDVRLNFDSRGFPLGDGVVEYENPVHAQQAILMLNETALMGLPISLRFDNGKTFSCFKCGGNGHLARDCSEPDVCYKCGGVGHFAKDCTSSEGKETRSCFFCKQSGHLAKDCPSEEGDGCYKCGGKGHIARSCPEPNSILEDQRECFVCGKKGHLIKDCPDKDKTDQKCFKCGEAGHIATNCSLPDERYCFACGRRGHLAAHCPTGRDSRNCYLCGLTGHIAKDCKEPSTGQRSRMTRCIHGSNCRFLISGTCQHLHSESELLQARRQRGQAMARRPQLQNPMDQGMVPQQMMMPGSQHFPQAQPGPPTQVPQGPQPPPAVPQQYPSQGPVMDQAVGSTLAPAAYSQYPQQQGYAPQATNGAGGSYGQAGAAANYSQQATAGGPGGQGYTAAPPTQNGQMYNTGAKRPMDMMDGNIKRQRYTTA